MAPALSTLATPYEVPLYSMNHAFPSGPVVMSYSPGAPAPTGYEATCPFVGSNRKIEDVTPVPVKFWLVAQTASCATVRSYATPGSG